MLIAFAHRPRRLAQRSAPALADAISSGADDRLEPSPLSAEEADRLLSEDFSEAIRRELYLESGGNPFYLDQLAARRPSRPPTRDGPDGGQRRGPADGPRRSRGGAERAHTEQQEVVRAAATIGTHSRPDLVAEAAGLGEDDALGAVESLVELDLVRPGLPRGAFAFAAIVRRAVYESAGPVWRLAAHPPDRRGARAPGGAGAGARRHLKFSAEPGDEAALGVLAEAGHAAMAVHRPRPLLVRGCARPAARRRRAGAAPGACSSPWPCPGQRRPLESSRAALRETLGLLGPDLAPVRGQVVAFIAMIEHLLGRHGEATALLERALEELPDRDSREAAALELERAMDCLYAPDYEGMLRRARAAHRGAAAQQEGPLLAAAAGALALAEYNVGHIAAAETALAEAAARRTRSATQRSARAWMRCSASAGPVRPWNVTSREFATSSAGSRCHAPRGRAICSCRSRSERRSA